MLAVLGLLAAQTANATIILDQLSIFQNVFVPDAGVNATATTNSGVVLDNGSDSFIGSDREVFVQRVSAAPANNQVSLQAGFGEFNYNSSNLTQGRAKIVYDGASGDSVITNFDDAPDSYLLGLNLTNYYKLTVVASTDNKPLPLTVTLYSSNSVLMTHTIVLQTPNPLTPATYSFYFNDFAVTGGTLGGILANVNAVAIAFNADYSGQIGADSTVSLLEFTQIPEPGTLALVGISLLSAGAFFRKRRA